MLPILRACEGRLGLLCHIHGARVARGSGSSSQICWTSLCQSLLLLAIRTRRRTIRCFFTALAGSLHRTNSPYPGSLKMCGIRWNLIPLSDSSSNQHSQMSHSDPKVTVRPKFIGQAQSPGYCYIRLPPVPSHFPT